MLWNSKERETPSAWGPQSWERLAEVSVGTGIELGGHVIQQESWAGESLRTLPALLSEL